MPSSSPTAGRYPSSRWARRRSAAVSRTSPGWSPWRSIRTSRPSVRPISSINIGGGDAVHAIRNIGIVALARPVPVHPDRLSTGDEVGEAMDREVGPLARPVHREEPEASDLHAVEMRERVRHQLPGALAGG